MRLKIITDEGETRTIKNVLAYDYLCKEDADLCAVESWNEELTENDYKRISRYIDKMERFPNMEELCWIVRKAITKGNEEGGVTGYKK